jgi:hypothetical protein
VLNILKKYMKEKKSRREIKRQTINNYNMYLPDQINSYNMIKEIHLLDRFDNASGLVVQLSLGWQLGLLPWSIVLAKLFGFLGLDSWTIIEGVLNRMEPD